MKTTLALVALSFVPTAFATVAFSAPVASSNLKAGSSYKLQWRDDGTTPSLATFGQATFSLGVGGSVQQVILQELGTADVSKVNSLSITIDASSGQNAQGTYFIRADSTTKDPTNQYGAPYQAFSAKFDLTGMTGNWNATVSQIAAAGSTSATGNATVSAVTGSAASVLTPTVAASSTLSRSTITSTLPASSIVSTKNGSAIANKPAFGIAIAALVAAFAA